MKKMATWRLESRAQVVDVASAVRDGVLSGEPAEEADDDDVPAVFVCPISLEPMSDPVTLCTGQTYEKKNIERWLGTGRMTCPTTMQELWDDTLTPNGTLKQLILAWFAQRRRRRKERADDVGGRVTALVDSARNPATKRARAQALKDLHRLLSAHPAAVKPAADAGAVCLAASVLGPYTSHDVGAVAVSVLSLVPLNRDARRILVRPAVMSVVADLLNEGSSETRLCCARLLENLFSKEEMTAVVHCLSLRLLAGLVRMVKDKGHPEGVVPGLRLLRGLCRQFCRLRSAIVSVGAVPQIVDRLTSGNADCLEIGFEVLAGLAEEEGGRAAITACDGAVPAAVRAMMTVSEKCTGHALAVLWAVCRGPPECGLVRAIEAGMAAKLLLVIQSGCGAPLRQRAAELLKLCSLNYDADLFVSKCRLDATIQ